MRETTRNIIVFHSTRRIEGERKKERACCVTEWVAICLSLTCFIVLWWHSMMFSVVANGESEEEELAFGYSKVYCSSCVIQGMYYGLSKASILRSVSFVLDTKRKLLLVFISATCMSLNYLAKRKNHFLVGFRLLFSISLLVCHWTT